MFRVYDTVVPDKIRDDLVFEETRSEIDLNSASRRQASLRAKCWFAESLGIQARIPVPPLSSSIKLRWGLSEDGYYFDTEVHADNETMGSVTRYAVVLSKVPHSSTMVFRNPGIVGAEYHTHQLFERDKDGKPALKPEFAELKDLVVYDQAQDGQIFSFDLADPHAAPPLFPGEFKGFLHYDVDHR